jgi:mono/diheme cytochrome c family protein
MRTALILALAIPTLAFSQAEKKQGLSVSYSAGGKTDVTTSRLAALYVPKGSPATPFLPVGPFKAVFTADIASALRSEFTFAVEVRGQVKVKINGNEILDAAGAAAAQYADKTVQLNKGANAVVIEFANDGEEDALLRFDWWSKEFPREPVPPTVWKHTPDAAGAMLREGRMLFATRHCASCHDAGGAVAKDGTGMPELLSTPPDLMDAGARFQPAWLAAWIENPRAIRPDATMPHLPLTKAQSADIAAYLVTTAKAVKEDALPVDDTVLGKGAALFGNLGCVSCHTTPDATEADKEHGRMPLAHVGAKFHPAALREFLTMPGMHNPWTRMPNFRLTPDETTELAAYLRTNAKAEFPAVKGDAASGKKLFLANCASCHTSAAGVATTKAAALTAVIGAGAKGCLAEKPEKAPDFGFSTSQREAVLAFLKTDLVSLKQDTFADFAERQIKHNNCTACHPRDGQQSTFQLVEGELATLTANAPHPEGQTEGNTVPATAIPQLTWLGEKLQPGWSGSFIAGAAPYKPRPWLASRMPGFGAPGVGIANGLAQQHGLPLSDMPEKAGEKETTDAGNKLLGADGGFNCIQCHGVKDLAATSVFEAPGINLAYSTERLRKGYFLRWMLAPLRIDAETKMPKFSEDAVSTQLTDVLEGKADKQFDAIWQYLRTVK